MILSFHPCFTADHQIILGSRSLGKEDRNLIRNAGAVILPQGRVDSIYHACKAAKVPMFPNYDMRFAYPGKVGQSRMFEDLALPHPRTLRWRVADALKDAFGLPHDFPFVVKDDRSHEAEGVFVVTGPESLAAARGFLKRKDDGKAPFITQDFVPTGGNILRAVILGKRILTYWKRPVEPGQIITTISKGARVDHDWRPALQEKGKALARILAQRARIDLAAVDFVFCHTMEDPDPLFLEINYFFGRRGLGGMDAYYRLLFEAIQAWLANMGLNKKAVKLV